MTQNRMKSGPPIRFSVHPDDEIEAILHFSERGYSPQEIEKGEGGLVYLLFPILPDDQMSEFMQAMPSHLSAKIGVIMGNRELR